MKVCDKEKSVVVYTVRADFLPSNENSVDKNEENIDIKEKEEVPKHEVHNFLADLTECDQDFSGNDLVPIKNKKVENAEIIETVSNCFLINNEEDNENSETFNNLILENNKTEFFEEIVDVKNENNECNKTDCKSPCKNENNFISDETSLGYETDPLKLPSDFLIVTEENPSKSFKFENEVFDKINPESVVILESSVLSSVNEVNGIGSISVPKSSDEVFCINKDNSESDTRSILDNSRNKIIKRKRRRREAWWSKKRKRNDGNNSKICNINNSKNTEWKAAVNKDCFSGEKVIKSKGKINESNDTLQRKNREYVAPSPSLGDICMNAAVPESTETSTQVLKTKLCLCSKKPHVFISGNNNSGDLYCQALDCIDKRIVGCCNTIPSKDVGLYRASEKASYQMMCDVHQQRLLRHNCCPGCGLFCTQGKYWMCKSWHHFHKTCVSDNIIVCPHCGDSSSLKSVEVSIHSSKDPVFLPHQKPIRNIKSAKMSISRGKMHTVDEAQDPIFDFPQSLFKLDGVSCNGIPQSLQRDKLANLLNIACRSFSRMCCSNRYSVKNLYNAAHSGDTEKLLKIIASGLNPNHVFEDNNKQTPLHLAACNGHLSAVHILLQAKAQINVFDAEQCTPLIVAINSKRNDVVKYLIKAGADLLLKGEDGMTPLHIAAKCGNVGACYHILNGTHLPPRYIDNLDDGGWTAMVWASEFNHLEVVRFLMNKGSDPLIRDAEQNIALHWAAYGGSIDIVEMFLNDGSDINAVNVHGDTPLHIAARQHKYNCVLLLLARGARSDIKNKNGELPRDCSESPTSDIYKGITLNMEISSLLTRFQNRAPKIVSNDISRGKERNQIQCVNEIDDESEPEDFVYVSESCFTSKITVDRTINSLQFCKCKDSCSSDECNCSVISIKCWYDNDGRLRSDFNYCDPPLIFECNQACRCNRITCRNRVVQNGITCKFQLFRTEERGWGIKTLSLIPKGTFVCEYVGEIISDWEADHREDDSYLFDLENRDGETYCIDARHYGNFARFINHMCVPNLMPVHIFVDHQDLRFPRIAFFANRDILPNEELGYNYGDKFWVIKWKTFTCSCGSEKCLYSENTIKTTLENYQKKLSEENP